ncbi:hypothetical protein ES705_33858 [subsurface metagenome]
MTKKKSDSLRTSKNKRISPYGEYYIDVKKINIVRQEQEDRGVFYPHFYPQISLGYPMLIRAIFETDKEYFNKSNREKWVHNIPISTSLYVEGDIYHYDISIYFPSLTTLNIIKNKCFIKLLLGDKEVYGALTHFHGIFDISNLPGTPPISAFGSFLKRQIVDIETKLKLRISYPIAFEDIEGAQNMEIRERALRKFGYEDYVKEGFWKKKIICVMFNNHDNLYINPSFNMDYYDEFRRTVLSRQDDEKIICFDNDIAFLQVKDTSTNKTYFLKVPPTMQSVEEAKAWTFGLNPEEYNPVIET